MADLPPLKRWVHPGGKVVLLGDACHPMLPYLAQGAAQATEDAATLAAALSAYSDLKEALLAYERQRLPRAAAITANTRVHQTALHLFDGKEQEIRDKVMDMDIEECPVFWGYTPRKDWLFAHDASKLGPMVVPKIPEPDFTRLPAAAAA
jgi:salicylate hydroxylase